MAPSLAIHIQRKNFILHNETISILGELHLNVAQGEFVSVVGPSGCGKTTLLRLILGLETQFEGEIFLGGRRITRPGLDRGIVFQEPRLLPWYSVHKNIAFALKDGDSGAGSQARIMQLIKLVGLDGFENAWPRQLSGGMAQRAALARALVNVPDLLLLDEPFGALDSQTRARMQDELLQVLNREGTTTLMVTHDIDEALYLSDRVIVLSSRPASIRATFTIPFPRPRSRFDKGYSSVRAELLECFYA